ncbi:MAG: hypothetical protein RR461_10045 [Angelakisella sp.]
MSVNEAREEFYSFLVEYANFFREMAGFEQQKLEVLLGNRLPEIEHAISVTQANAMALTNLENKRIRLQRDAGLAEMSFSQLAETASEGSRQQLRELMDQLNGYLRDIKFYNTKSMDVAQLKLKAQERTAVRSNEVHPRTATPTKLETKA